ncbi:MAG: class II glutamine amidotransferase [Lachnospiraceae bacterium]|nr:class II glutamine amidotransferase [Lachnospiraceae bacterium]
MCAVFGVLDYKGNLEAVQRLRLVKALGTAAEVRGTDATGIAFFQRNRLCIQKAAKPAHKMKYRIPSEVRYIMGHTRMTTQGSASKNQNNHPFSGKAGGTAFALAHNGMLHNDRELQFEHDLPKTNVETDSYVAVQLIEQKKELTFDSLRGMAEAVEGSFVFTVLGQDNSLYFVKGDNPLTIYHYPKLGLYLYASTEDILLIALNGLWLERIKPDMVQPEDGEILRIDCHGEQSYERFAMMDSWSAWMLPVWEPAHAVGRRCPVSEYIQDLKSIAGCYGYTAQEVNDMLSNGYTPEEVENMFYY